MKGKTKQPRILLNQKLRAWSRMTEGLKPEEIARVMINRERTTINILLAEMIFYDFKEGTELKQNDVEEVIKALTERIEAKRGSSKRTT